MTAPTAPTIRARRSGLASVLTAPVGEALLGTGFSAFSPRLETLDGIIRQEVRGHDPARPARRLVTEAFHRRQRADGAAFRVVVDVPVGPRRVDVLVAYRGRWGAVDVVGVSPNSRDGRRPAGVALAVRFGRDEVTDAEAADELVDRFLRDLAATSDRR